VAIRRGNDRGRLSSKSVRSPPAPTPILRKNARGGRDCGKSRSDCGKSRSGPGKSRSGPGKSRSGPGKSRNDCGKSRSDSGKSRNDGGKSRDDCGNSRNDSGKSRYDSGTSRNRTGKPEMAVGIPRRGRLVAASDRLSQPAENSRTDFSRTQGFWSRHQIIRLPIVELQGPEGDSLRISVDRLEIGDRGSRPFVPTISNANASVGSDIANRRLPSVRARGWHRTWHPVRDPRHWAKSRHPARRGPAERSRARGAARKSSH
jgi:hypothetical protein